MAESYTLFIVISKTFCFPQYLGDKSDEGLPLINSALTGLKEPPEIKNLWGLEPQGPVVEVIKKWQKLQPHLRARIAAHASTCFDLTAADKESDRNRRHRDRRFPDKEKALTGKLGAGFDVQVWGFHHISPTSRIWTVLETVRDVVRGEATEEKKQDFESRLKKAFAEAQAATEADVKADRGWTVYERLAVIKHDLTGLFNHLCIRLDTAADQEAKARRANSPAERAQAAARAEKIRGEVNSAVPSKLARAHELLDSFDGVIPGVRQSEWWKKAAARLEAPPQIEREEFRSWADALEEDLKNLVKKVAP